MQILVNFNIEGMCIRQSLSDTILRILLSCFLVSITGLFRNENVIYIVFIFFRKLIKPHMAG